jgi:hypothetical protein
LKIFERKSKHYERKNSTPGIFSQLVKLLEKVKELKVVWKEESNYCAANEKRINLP